VAAIATALGAFIAWFWTRTQRRKRLPGRTLIVSHRKSTVIGDEGAVRSVQSAELTLPQAEFERLWTPANLENLGRTYWRFLTRSTLGLVRVKYTDHDRTVVLLLRPLVLLRFTPPEYELENGRGRISWRIVNGLLVSRSRGQSGWLAIDVRAAVIDTDTASITVDVEVANFYPAIASRLSATVYGATQAFIHVLVTHAFLRSLATLELAESRVGKLRDAGAANVSPNGSENGAEHDSGGVNRPQAD
jgi:hypothetical protein